METATARILDGKATAKQIRAEIQSETTDWIAAGGPVPTLAAVLVGDDPASQVYVQNKERACQQTGMQSRLVRLPSETSTDELLDLLAELNEDASVSGILVQLPLPAGVDTQQVLDAVNPEKDVDAFAPENVGLLVQGRPRFLPCTPHGVLQILWRHQVTLAGKHVVIVGRSEIVGKPLANMLVQRDAGLGVDFANATVTVCHSRSENLTAHLQQADVVVAAVGQPKMITGQMLKPGAVVIDVGINRVEQGLVGDVDFDSACQTASAITPVPGGVGPLTIAMLLRNTLTACQLQHRGQSS